MSASNNQKEVSFKILELKGISRRKFIKYCAATAAVFGLDYYFGSHFAEATTAVIGKKPVIWIQGQGCTGCSCSLLSSINPGPAEILLDLVSMRFNSTIMNAAGHLSAEVLADTVEQEGYLLVVEGSIPTGDPRYCFVEGIGFDELLAKTAKNAAAVIAAGSCSAYGGIPRAGFTGAKGVAELVTDKPVINIPGCPFKPDWLVGTLMYYLNFNELPPLDELKRPRAYFGNHFIHDTCPRVAYFEKGQFLTDWNNPDTVNWCLLKMGCKGPVTHSDCNRIWFNDGANSCIRSGSPCAGCVEPQFYKDLSPLYVSPLAPDGPQLDPVSNQTGGIDPGSAALGAGIVAAPFLVSKVAELLNKKKEGEAKHGE
ncbi:MAG: hydrogenase small subunit [Bacillota bacterium]